MEKYSKQREEVLKCIKNNHTHLTAEEIYTMLKHKNPNISRGTVYRNLNFLTQKNLINQISVPGMPEKYDYIYEKHSHIICKTCGNIFNLQMELSDEMKNAIKNLSEIEDFSNEFIVYGICKKCKSK